MTHLASTTAMVKDPSTVPQVLLTAPLGLLVADGVAADAFEVDPDVLVMPAEVALVLDVMSLADRVADCVVAVCAGKRSGGVTTDKLSSRMIAKSGLVLFMSPSTAHIATYQLAAKRRATLGTHASGNTTSSWARRARGRSRCRPTARSLARGVGLCIVHHSVSVPEATSANACLNADARTLPDEPSRVLLQVAQQEGSVKTRHVEPSIIPASIKYCLSAYVPPEICSRGSPGYGLQIRRVPRLGMGGARYARTWGPVRVVRRVPIRYLPCVHCVETRCGGEVHESQEEHRQDEAEHTSQR